MMAGPSGNQTPSEIARTGITLFLNNNAGEAEALFIKNKDSSVQVRGGYCFVTFMNAMMTFEEDKIALSMQVLKETEQRSNRDLGTLHATKKFFSTAEEAALNYEQRLEQQIVLGDCHVCIAMLLFTFHEVTGYVKGAWVLRKAWKVYDRTYREIKKLYQACFGAIPSSLSHESLPDLPPLSVTDEQATSDASEGWLDTEESQDALTRLAKTTSIADVPCPLSQDVVTRLMAGVSFGYGLFQLCLSLSPANLLKMIHVFGFEGNREVALNCLSFSRKGEDMRSPLSAITLLWYHTIIRPFFGIDDHNIAAGCGEAQAVLADSKIFENSAMYLFYRGRVERLKGALDPALVIFQKAVATGEQKEVQFICYQEIGWCLLLKLQWEESLELFQTLKRDMRWGKSFHTYFVAICFGVLGQIEDSQAAMAEIPNMLKKKNNQLESFVLKRAQYHTKNNVTQDITKLYVMEILYLWRTISCAPERSKREFLTYSTQITPPPRLVPLRCLIEGTLRAETGDATLAKKCFEECISKGTAVKEDQHVPAFACYELGLLLGKTNSTANQAKQALHQAKDNYKSYDFENRLTIRVHSALTNLERRNVAGGNSNA